MSNVWHVRGCIFRPHALNPQRYVKDCKCNHCVRRFTEINGVSPISDEVKKERQRVERERRRVERERNEIIRERGRIARERSRIRRAQLNA